jgi:hypothetical protein
VIRNRRFLQKCEKKHMREETSDFFHNLRLFEGLYEEARALGALPLKNPLEGLENKVRLARRLNVSRAA